MANFRPLLALTFAALASSAFTQLPNSDALLEQVVQANLALKCKGIRAVTWKYVGRDGKPGQMQFREVIVRDGKRIRTEYVGNTDLAGQIAIDDGTNRLHYYPKENAIHKSPSLLNQDSQRLEMLMQERRKDYKVTIADGGKVATYPTYLITLKSEKGFTHKVWVERRGKAILKREMSGPDPNRGSAFEFESFEYRRRIESENFQINKSDATVLDPLDRLALFAKKVEYTPYAISGDQKFVLYEAGSFETPREKAKVLRSTYGDGKRVLTLFQFRGSIEPDRLKGRFTGVRAWKEDGYNFVLVGDLTSDELERLAKLVRR